MGNSLAIKNLGKFARKGAIPWNKGLPSLFKGVKRPPRSEEWSKRISLAKKGTIPWNKGKKNVYSEETLEKFRNAPRFGHCKGRKFPSRGGGNHYLWKKDRNLIKGTHERNNPEYKQWRKEVWLRDNFTCKIANPNCEGRIEAHHILGWRDYPELRYQVNNGITLCHAHHPRKRAEEKRLSSYFMELVSVSKMK